MAAAVIEMEELVCPICEVAHQRPETTADMKACPSCMLALIQLVNGLTTMAELPAPMRAAINREVERETDRPAHAA